MIVMNDTDYWELVANICSKIIEKKYKGKEDAIQWMTNLWIDLSKYYNYEAPIGWQTNSNISTSYSLNFTSKYKK